MGFLIRVIVNAIALFIIAYFHIIPGVSVTGIVGALIAALILGLVNAILRPILVILSLPLEILTLGLFTLVINGFLFWLVGALGIGLIVRGFWAGFWGAIATAIISWILSLFTGGLESSARRT
ncbi:MAG TPA: phage holin family protein [Candidatus Baltobacteraceae bacterium]|nr:phage holin family protein [Candidatus Baltobacteraceae bacterium]